MRFFKCTHDITRAVSHRGHLDLQSLEQARPRMTVDTAQRRIRAILYPTSTMNARQMSRNDEIESFANLDVKWRALR